MKTYKIIFDNGDKQKVKADEYNININSHVVRFIENDYYKYVLNLNKCKCFYVEED